MKPTAPGQTTSTRYSPTPNTLGRGAAAAGLFGRTPAGATPLESTHHLGSSTQGIRPTAAVNMGDIALLAGVKIPVAGKQNHAFLPGFGVVARKAALLKRRLAEKFEATFGSPANPDFQTITNNRQSNPPAAFQSRPPVAQNSANTRRFTPTKSMFPPQKWDKPKLSPNGCDVLVVVDMQPTFPSAQLPWVLKGVEEAIDVFRNLNKQIIFLEYSGKPETFSRLTDRLNGYARFTRVKKSRNDGSLQILELLPQDSVVSICGVNTSFCVKATLAGLVKNEVHVNVIANACECEGGHGFLSLHIIKHMLGRGKAALIPNAAVMSHFLSKSHDAPPISKNLVSISLADKNIHSELEVGSKVTVPVKNGSKYLFGEVEAICGAHKDARVRWNTGTKSTEKQRVLAKELAESQGWKAGEPCFIPTQMGERKYYGTYTILRLYEGGFADVQDERFFLRYPIAAMVKQVDKLDNLRVGQRSLTKKDREICKINRIFSDHGIEVTIGNRRVILSQDDLVKSVDSFGAIKCGETLCAELKRSHSLAYRIEVLFEDGTALVVSPDEGTSRVLDVRNFDSVTTIQSIATYNQRNQ